MRILVAHPGTQHVRHLVTGMADAGHDVLYSTTMAFGRDSKWEGIIPGSFFNKRFISNIPDSIIDRHSLLELIPGIFQKFGVDAQHAYATRNRVFQERISSNIINRQHAIIGFDTSSGILADRAQKVGVPFFLELTTVHPHEKARWFDYLRTHYPQWPATVVNKPADLVKIEEQEIELATTVSTASSYVRQTYNQYAQTKKEISVNPFGADLAEFHPKVNYNQRPKFLFLGAFNAAKGIPVLLDAWKLARPEADLVIAGYGNWPSGVEVPRGVTIMGRIQKNEREKFFHSGDVFICPSLYEGLAIVQMEAAACGLAVIGTYNSGASEFIEYGKEGLLVEPGNVNALAEKITFLSENRDAREQMGRAAASKVLKFTWNRYVRQWIDTISKYVSQ